MSDVPVPAVVLIGSLVAVIGLLFMWFRVPVATSQTPGLVFVVGAGFFVVGAFLAIGTLAGWVHPR